jgi:tetratricopeptide (TPR) repeat protein
MRLLLAILLLASLSACSFDQMMVRASTPLIDGGIHALNQESDLDLAEASIPANIEMLEGMIHVDPDNIDLHTYAAQAYYGYAYGFNEDVTPHRAAKLYVRGLNHGLRALELLGVMDAKTGTVDEFEQALGKLGKAHVDTLFWTASNWGKWVDVNRDSPEGIIALPRVTALMQRVLDLDDTYYYGGAHLYFGIYYGSRAPALGGDYKKSEQHFQRARDINDDKLLVVDMLQAQYLERQRFDQKRFNSLLNRVIEAPEDLAPGFALMNQIAKRKAQKLLGYQSAWF